MHFVNIFLSNEKFAPLLIAGAYHVRVRTESKQAAEHLAFLQKTKVRHICSCLLIFRGELCYLIIVCIVAFRIQCFDAVGWVSGKASSPKKLTDEVMAWLSSGAKCK